MCSKLRKEHIVLEFIGQDRLLVPLRPVINN